MQGTYLEESLSLASSIHNSSLHLYHYWMPWPLWHSDYQPVLVQLFGPFLGISLALDTLDTFAGEAPNVVAV